MWLPFYFARSVSEHAEQPSSTDPSLLLFFNCSLLNKRSSCRSGKYSSVCFPPSGLGYHECSSRWLVQDPLNAPRRSLMRFGPRIMDSSTGFYAGECTPTNIGLQILFILLFKKIIAVTRTRMGPRSHTRQFYVHATTESIENFSTGGSREGLSGSTW
jgi:hypothetical protein